MEPEILKYGDHDLQEILVWQLASTPTPSKAASKPWIIYIHGGGWRDPRVSASSLSPTLKYLLNDPKNGENFVDKVAAIASIDYRLSPHPEFPQDIETTSPKQLRDAVHPVHITDVRDAMRLLCEKYGFGNNYLLVGHSVGATMAFWLNMKSPMLVPPEPQVSIPAPRCIIGVAGIYNIRALVENHAQIPIYRQFVSKALGPDEDGWDRLSPALLTEFDDSWTNAGRIVLAYSPDDGLVETSQATEMDEAVRKTAAAKRCELMQLKGAHDEIWEHGTQLGVCIIGALERLS